MTGNSGTVPYNNDLIVRRFATYFQNDMQHYLLGGKHTESWVDHEKELRMAFVNVSLLTSIPEQHLLSGLETQKATGKVALSSTYEDVLTKLQDLRNGGQADVFICATPCNDPDPKATWRAVFLGYKSSVGPNKGHPDGAKYRPKTTENEQSNFYWEIADLRRLSASEQIPITKILSYATDKAYGPYAPRRPLLVHSPAPTSN